MIALLLFLLNLLGLPFKSKSGLAAENAALRQQVIVLQRKIRGRVEFTDHERLFFIQLYRWFPSVLNAIKIIRPETLLRWHRAGFRRYWRWNVSCRMPWSVGCTTTMCESSFSAHRHPRSGTTA